MNRMGHQKFGKKLLLSLGVVIGLSAATAEAQDMTGHLGIVGGAQYTNYIASNESFNGGISYIGGLSYQNRFSRQWGAEVQLGYMGISASTKYKDSISYNTYVQRYDNNYSFNSTYAHIQLFAKYYIPLGGEPITPYDRPNGDGNYFYILAGGYVSGIPGFGPGKIGRTGSQTQMKHINFTPNDSGVKTSYTFTDASDQESKDQNALNTIDFGATLGVGVTLRLSSMANLEFSVRYSQGLSNFDSPITKLDKLTAEGFFLGHASLVQGATSTETALHYDYAPVNTQLISFNVGLNFKIYGDAY